MIRVRKLALVTACSSALVLATVVSWLRSYRRESPDQMSCRVAAARYTLRATRGKFVLSGPPFAASRKEAERLVRALTNDDLHWVVTVERGRAARGWQVGQPQPPGEFYLFFVQLAFLRHGAVVTWRDDQHIIPEAVQLQRMPGEAAARALLDALEDPHRFAAAHAMLVWKQLPGSYELSCRPCGDGLLAIDDGLQALLRPNIPAPPAPSSIDADTFGERGMASAVRSQTGDYWNSLRGKLFICGAPQTVAIDPIQLPRIRQQWHDRLDVRIVAVPHAAVVGAFLVAPAIWCWRRYRRLTAARRGLCPDCGYDIRASPERCPECGRPLAHAVKTRSEQTFYRKASTSAFN